MPKVRVQTRKCVAEVTRVSVLNNIHRFTGVAISFKMIKMQALALIKILLVQHHKKKTVNLAQSLKRQIKIIFLNSNVLQKVETT